MGPHAYWKSRYPKHEDKVPAATTLFASLGATRPAHTTTITTCQSISNCLAFSTGALDDFDKTPPPPAPEPSGTSSSASGGADKVCFFYFWFCVESLCKCHLFLIIWVNSDICFVTPFLFMCTRTISLLQILRLLYSSDIVVTMKK